MRDRRSWRAYIAGASLLILTAAVVVTGSALALGHARHSSGMITFVAPATATTSAELYGLDVDTGLRTTLIADVVGNCPAWSPDGKSAALAAPATAATLPLTLDSAGGLHFYPTPTYFFTWSADNRHLLLEMDLEEQFDIYLMDIASGELRNLTANLDLTALRPILSPDGGQIVFLSESDVGTDIYLTGVDGTGLRRLASLNPIYIELMGWRAESRELVMLSQSENTSGIYMLDVDSARLSSLVEPVRDFQARLSPDGRHLAFSGRMEGDELSVYLMELNTEPPRRIYSASGSSSIRNLRWSPDSTRLAFVSYESGGLMPANEALYLYPINAEEPQLLARAVSVHSPLIWSPDGRQLAFRADSRANLSSELYTMDVESGAQRRLTSGLGEASCFAWVP